MSCIKYLKQMGKKSIIWDFSKKPIPKNTTVFISYSSIPGLMLYYTNYFGNEK